MRRTSFTIILIFITFGFIKPKIGYAFRADILWYLGEGHQSYTGSEQARLNELEDEGFSYEKITSSKPNYGGASQFVIDGKLQYPNGQPRYGMILIGGGSSSRYYDGRPESECESGSQKFCGPGLKSTGRAKMRNFIDKGGNYVGMCAGAFFASERYYCNWNENSSCGAKGKYLDIWHGITNSHGVGPFSIRHYLNQSHPLNSGWGSYVDRVFFNGGCDLTPKTQSTPAGYVPSGTEKIADFSTDASQCFNADTGQVNPSGCSQLYTPYYDTPKMAIISYQKRTDTGRIVISGSHPEGKSFFDSMVKYALANKPPDIINQLKDGIAVTADLNAGETLQSNHYYKIGDKQYHYYSITIPGSQNIKLAVALTNNSADNDLYVRKGNLPSDKNYDYKSTNSEMSDENVTVASASAGVWFIAVQAWSDRWEGNSYTIRAGLSEAASPTPPGHCSPVGDIDCSGKVNGNDFGDLVSDWKTNNLRSDLNDSGEVNATDAARLFINYQNQKR